MPKKSIIHTRKVRTIAKNASASWLCKRHIWAVTQTAMEYPDVNLPTMLSADAREVLNRPYRPDLLATLARLSRGG